MNAPTFTIRLAAAAAIFLSASIASALEPDLLYVFPAGMQRGAKTSIRVGGVNFHPGCGFQMVGAGIQATGKLQPTETVWFEGPLLELSDSQRAEDYPRDYLSEITVAADAPLGARFCRAWTSQGVTQAVRFMVGEYPEILEQEADGEAVPVAVTLPLTINGRIFPREDIDVWTFQAKKGETIRAAVAASSLGRPADPRRREASFEARILIEDAAGRVLAEGLGDGSVDPEVEFTAPADGEYRARIHDISFGGLQYYVYRLTLAPAKPKIDSIFPLGGKRGSKTRFELSGRGMPTETVEVELPNAPDDTIAHRFQVAGGASEPVLIELDNLNETNEAEPNNEIAQATLVSDGMVLNGRIGKPGDLDYFCIDAKKGESWTFDVLAARLGSPLDSVLVVIEGERDTNKLDDISRDVSDSQFTLQVRQDGRQTFRIEDRFASRGGPSFGYRLRVARSSSDFKLRLPRESLTLERGKKVKLKVDLDAAAPLEVPIKISIDGLPDGVTIDEAVAKPRAKFVELAFNAAETAKIGVSALTIRGTAELPSGAITRTATYVSQRGEPAFDSLLLAVAAPTPFKVVGEFAQPSIPRGSVLKRKYTIERNGFEGPIEIRLADREARHRQGVQGPVITVPAGATEFEYPLYLPPWMLIGRTSRTCVMATGLLTDADGSQHLVVYSSLHQNDQMIARVSAALLGVSLEQDSLIVRPGDSARLGVRVQRGAEAPGAVSIELIIPSHITGVTTEPLVLAADQATGTLVLHFAAACGPLNMPLIVRGTYNSPDGPIVGETRLELVPAR